MQIGDDLDRVTVMKWLKYFVAKERNGMKVRRLIMGTLVQLR